ncbi:hypothetical protein ACV33M_32500, partial [Pseudomonas aeruginosa]
PVGINVCLKLDFPRIEVCEATKRISFRLEVQEPLAIDTYRWFDTEVAENTKGRVGIDEFLRNTCRDHRETGKACTFCRRREFTLVVYQLARTHARAAGTQTPASGLESVELRLEDPP